MSGRNTVVGIVTSEKTCAKLKKYCFNDFFSSERTKFDLAVVMNGRNAEGVKFIRAFNPEYFFERPNLGYDLAALDYLIKNLNEYEQYILLHDDHWFNEHNWFDKIVREHKKSNADILGNLVVLEEYFYSDSDNINLIKTIGYEEYLTIKTDKFLQGMAGIYSKKAMKKILKVDGIPHLHRNDRNATFILERLFSNVMIKEGIKIDQLSGGYEKFLKHSDHDETNRLYNNIDMAFKRNDFSEAAQITENVLLTKGKKVNTLLGLGRIYFSNGRIREATNYYTECLTIDPDNKDAKGSLYFIRDFIKKYSSES